MYVLDDLDRHFTKAAAKKESKELTAEDLLDQRAKQKYDKFC